MAMNVMDTWLVADLILTGGRTVQRLPYGLNFGAAVIPLCSGLLVCLPPRSLLPIGSEPYGSRDVYIRASHGLLPPHVSDMLAVRIGQLTAEDFHPIRLAALSAAYKTDPLICANRQEQIRIINFIGQPEVIKRILEHLGLWEEAHAPPDSDPPKTDITFDPSYSQLI